jgi:hypothetical protein
MGNRLPGLRPPLEARAGLALLALLLLAPAGCAAGLQAEAGEGSGAVAFLQAAFGPGIVSDRSYHDDEDEGRTPAVRGAPPELKYVERTLRRRGIRFGTDGTFGGLLSYFEFGGGRLISPAEARRGDVVFFDIGGRRCADHAGVVDGVDSSGRIAFRETRAGAVRLSYVHPRERSVRRSPDGRILNSFLRPRLADDPPDARYFAGEMLCAVGRARR